MTKQIDLFLDSIINAPIKDERATMEFPFFCLTKKPRTTPLEYSDGKTQIRVEPGPRGIATIWDKDVLIYCASLVNDRLERGLPVDRTIHIAAYDLLRVTQRGTGKRSYELLLDALVRLRSTTILTNITAGDERERRGFGWIDNFRVIERNDAKGNKIMAAIEVTMNDWMFRAICKEKRILTINGAYFKLKMGLERRLYEIARKHCGRQRYWDISMPKLHAKCGSQDLLRNFKASLNLIIRKDSLPQYRLEMLFDANSEESRAMSSEDRPLPPRWGGNDRIIIRFMPRKDAFIDSLPPPLPDIEDIL